MRGVRLLAAALVAADGLQGRQTPRRASCRVRAGAGFGAPKKAGTTKARRKRPRPPPRAAPARPALDKWGLPVAEPEDEDAPRDLGARKVSLEAPPVAVALPRSDELDCSPPRPQVNELAGDVGARLEQEAEDNGRAPTQLVASLRFETDETGATSHRSRPDRPDLLGRLGHPDHPDLPAGNQWTAARSRRGPLRYPHHGAAAVAKEGMALLLRLAVRPLL